ncbi:DUF5995 family protein [Halorientalis regularis]|uniref:Uncharacterized protein n=1 Tax=Halorientalis regularis TaxID=660518 RepID=A0A1G7PZ84_9EURY|nr:DUF5995 family protein [Halorientalis regularis]SDF90680.1 hypothetical protein SAMN05216218_11154 [Halorientalis regularis]
MTALLRTLSAYGDAARLVDTRRIRGMARALRHDVAQYDPPDTPDAELVGVAQGAFESVADAAERLRTLEDRLREREDRRAVFLTIYTRMTERISARIAAGGFRDPEWMRAYTTRFANYYRRAFLAFERGELGAVPDPWRIAFGTATGSDALVLQDAFLGINAHINYDLALTLRDVGIDADRAAKRADHRAVNEVLARLIDAQQRALAEVYAAGVADVDAALGRLDERLSLLGLREGREQAWRVAVVLTDVGFPPVASLARWVLRATATGGAAFVLGPSLDPDLLAELRRFEQVGFDLDDVLERLVRRLDESA